MDIADSAIESHSKEKKHVSRASNKPLLCLCTSTLSKADDFNAFVKEAPVAFLSLRNLTMRSRASRSAVTLVVEKAVNFSEALKAVSVSLEDMQGIEFHLHTQLAIV